MQMAARAFRSGWGVKPETAARVIQYAEAVLAVSVPVVAGADGRPSMDGKRWRRAHQAAKLLLEAHYADLAAQQVELKRIEMALPSGDDAEEKIIHLPPWGPPQEPNENAGTGK